MPERPIEILHPSAPGAVSVGSGGLGGLRMPGDDALREYVDYETSDASRSKYSRWVLVGAVVVTDLTHTSARTS